MPHYVQLHPTLVEKKVWNLPSKGQLTKLVTSLPCMLLKSLK